MTTTPTGWVREGLTVGLVAFTAVAVFYAAFDLLASRGVLFTVDRLGQVILRGSPDVATGGVPPARDPAAILVYSAIHLVCSLAIGLLVCRLVHEAEMEPRQAQVALLFICAGFAGTIALVGALSAPIRAVLPWWSIIIANTLAVLLAGLVMIRRHPEFVGRMTVSPRWPR